jgi:predicted AAA+ superfamily ATPase
MLTTPLFLFLDEVQYQSNWATVVKTLHDRTNKAFIVVTGSSAISLQNNPDANRRMILQKMYPFGFAEYIHAKFQKEAPIGLSDRLTQALFVSQTPQEVYTSLQKVTTDVNAFWGGIDRFE